MKLQNVIDKAQNDMLDKGFTSSRIIKPIKDNFDKISEDYDFQHICLIVIMLSMKQITMSRKML